MLHALPAVAFGFDVSKLLDSELIPAQLASYLSSDLFFYFGLLLIALGFYRLRRLIFSVILISLGILIIVSVPVPL